MTTTESVTLDADKRLDVVLKRDPTTYKVFGRITDDASMPLFLLADIQAVGGTNASKFTYADKSGNYELAGLPPGDLVLQGESSGYTSVTHTVHVSADTRLDFALTPTPACYWYYTSDTAPFPDNTFNFAAAGGSGDYTVWTNHAGCSWSLKLDAPAPWITFTPSSGTTRTTVRVSVAANTTGSPRSDLFSPNPPMPCEFFCGAEGTWSIRQSQ